jgi:hypothetical protein
VLQQLIIMRVSPKALVVVVAVVFVAAVVSAVPFQKTRVRALLAGGGSVTLGVPSFLGALRGSAATLRYERPGQNARTATLLHALFEQPIMVLPGPTDGTVLCVYDFDVGYRVIAFDVSGTQSEDNQELRIIVPKSEMSARHASVEEIAFAAERIAAMPSETFEALSIPTLDLGFMKTYAEQKNVVARVSEALSRERNRIAAVSR